MKRPKDEDDAESRSNSVRVETELRQGSFLNHTRVAVSRFDTAPCALIFLLGDGIDSVGNVLVLKDGEICGALSGCVDYDDLFTHFLVYCSEMCLRFGYDDVKVLGSVAELCDGVFIDEGGLKGGDLKPDAVDSDYGRWPVVNVLPSSHRARAGVSAFAGPEHLTLH